MNLQAEMDSREKGGGPTEKELFYSPVFVSGTWLYRLRRGADRGRE